jgi:glycosyltransferase involved in cell wall biosynthesis
VRVLIVHNTYQQPGGEDRVFALESALLEARGHRVIRYTTHNDRIAGMGRLGLARVTLWNAEVHRDLRALIRRERPDVAYYHNTFPLLSPSAIYAARAEGVPVIMALHNYRLLCVNALLFREGRVCEDCLGRAVPWPGVVHACYRGSGAASAVAASMLAVHRLLRTWAEQVDVYIALTEFVRRKFAEGGLPEERIAVKPHFVHPDPGPGDGSEGYALFVGRLSPEKGVDTLLAAWRRLGRSVPLRIVGDGPLAPQVAEAARRLPGVEWLGQRPAAEVAAMMGRAAFLVFPSRWYETFGRVIIEAYASGTPVIAAAIGVAPELVAPGRTGVLFPPGNPEALAARVEWATEHEGELARMRREARLEFESRYTAERNYRSLLEILQRAATGG